MVGLPDGEKTLRICVIVKTQYRRVTDRRTDILPRHSPRYAYASRGNECNYYYFKIFSALNVIHDKLKEFKPRTSLISVIR